MTGRFVAGVPVPPDGPYAADVVILSFERAAETLAAIRSALEQRGVSRHLFVLDQGSCPDTLGRLAAALDGRCDATLVALGTNHGVAGGRNIGTGLGHGRMIAGLDNDATFADDTTLARAVAALDAEPALGAIGFRIVEDRTGANPMSDDLTDDLSDDVSSWGYPPALLPQAAAVFDAVTFVGAGHAIRRAAWEDAGGYDPALFFCWEEYDFCLRAIACGWRIRYRGDIVVRHKVSAERRVTWSDARWFHFVRNRIYIGRKTGSVWLALAPRIVGYLLKGLRNGLATQTLRAIPAASRLARAAPPVRLSDAARAYLRRHDAAHRGGWPARLRREVLAGLPGQRFR
jgi:GT2 family glycosyltransferase